MACQIAVDLISRIRCRLAQDSRYKPELYTSYRFVYGAERCCHRLTVELIQEAAAELPRVAQVTGNRTLNVGRSPRWKPDAVLWDDVQTPLLVTEYLSLNSSDMRVI